MLKVNNHERPFVENSTLKGSGYVHSARVIDSDMDGSKVYVNGEYYADFLSVVQTGALLGYNGERSKLYGNSYIKGTAIGNIGGIRRQEGESEIEYGVTFNGTIGKDCFFRVLDNYSGELCNEMYNYRGQVVPFNPGPIPPGGYFITVDNY